MRVLFWCEIFLPHVGGIEILVSQLAQTLVKGGHACEIITNRHDLGLPAKEDHHGALVHRLDFAQAMRSGDPRRMHQLSMEVRAIRAAFQPEVNHIYLAGPLVALLQMSNRAPVIPTITSLQTPLETVLRGGTSVMRLLKESAVIIAANESLRRGVSETLPEVEGRTNHLANSVMRPACNATPPSVDAPVLLGLGRLVEEKGFDIALRAMSLLDSRWNHVRMVLVGEGPERAKLEALAVELGLAGRVEFKGGVANDAVPAMMNRATVVLMPSRWQEPFGMVCLEAALMARPVVANSVGGIPTVVEDGETGLLVENENPVAMAQAIHALLEDPERLSAMGERARQRAEAKFGFQAYVKQHVEWYQEAAAAATARV